MRTGVITIITAVIFLLFNSVWAHGPTRVKFLHEGDKAPDFTLINQDGKTITLKDFKGRPVFITFIYTNCPDTCPLILQNRQRLKESIERGMGQTGLVFLGLTVDPDVDSPGVLKDYIKRLEMDPKDLHLLTGKHEVVEKVLVDYGIEVEKDKESDQVGHSVIGYVINGQGIIDKLITFTF